jgi:hypothetical protein
MDLSQLEFLGYGLCLGLLVALWVWFDAWREGRRLKRELLRLQEHLNTQMVITHEGSAAREQKLEQLRVENENLRIALQTWRQKPDRRDLRLLQVYDHALHQLLEATPGFSVHWEGALRKAEQHVAASDRGLVAFARNWLSPRAPSRLEAAKGPLTEEEAKGTEEG